MAKIREKLLKDIEEFCELNELVVDDFVNNIIQKGFMDIKWSEHLPNKPKPKKEKWEEVIGAENFEMLGEPMRNMFKTILTTPLKEANEEEIKSATPNKETPHRPNKRDLYDE